MPKRKREFNPPASNGVASSEPPMGARHQRTLFKLNQSLSPLTQAFKLAKGFERQKLGRRTKNALTDNRNADAKRIADEIEALKELEPGTCARYLLQKTMARIKAVYEREERLPEEWRGIPAPLAGTGADSGAGEIALQAATARLNVFGRLCNANPVKTALPTVLDEVQRAIGIEVVETEEGNKKKKRLRAKDFAEAEAAAKKEDEDISATGRNKILETSLNQDQSDSDSEEFAGFDDRIAPSDEDEDLDQLDSDDNENDDEDEDLDIDDLERQLEQEGFGHRPSKTKSKSTYNHTKDLSLSPTPSASRSPSPPPKISKTRTTQEAPRKSAFLPSLTLGGYISASDSEAEDLEDHIAPPRKNRRGQRARQQIWEKKYGQKAKHVANPKPQTGVNAINSGWDMKRGATDGRRGKFGGSKGGRVGGGAGGAATGAAEPPKKKHKDDEGPIHPSWEAAKKAKAAREAPVAFAGKKITFD